jgi:putative ABC transport system ATP-binding protein
MIELKQVERVYPLKGGPFYALRAITLSIAEGDFVSVMGPSGSGKSTLLNILGLHDSAWAGEYHFGGTEVHALNQKRRLELQKKNIGFVFQSYHLLDDLTVYENLEIPLTYRDVPKVGAADHRLRHARPIPHCRKEGPLPFPTFGRAAAARGGRAGPWSRNPRLILADEPTGNLHSDQGREIMELFKQLNPKTA